MPDQIDGLKGYAILGRRAVQGRLVFLYMREAAARGAPISLANAWIQARDDVVHFEREASDFLGPTANLVRHVDNSMKDDLV